MMGSYTDYLHANGLYAMQQDAQRQQARARHWYDQQEMVRRAHEAAASAAAAKRKFDNRDALDLVCIDGVWQEQKALPQR